MTNKRMTNMRIIYFGFDKNIAKKTKRDKERHKNNLKIKGNG